MLLEEMRPRTLAQFIGNRDAVQAACAYMEGSTQKPAALFLGQPGTGKTTLAHILADAYNLVVNEINASDHTSKKKADEILKQVRSLSLDGKPKLLVMDEAERADSELLEKILDSRGKKIFIVNEPHRLHWRVKNACQHVSFDLPDTSHYEALLDRIGMEAPPEILTQFRSYRDVCNWVEGGDAQSPLILTESKEIERIFAGDPPAKIRSDPQRVLEYYFFNGGNTELSSHLDMMLRNGQYKAAQRIIKSLSLDQVVQTPYRWKEKRTQFKKRKQVHIRVLGFKE